MRWVSLPIQYSPWKGTFLLAVVLTTAVAVFFSTQNFAWAVFSTILLLIGVHDFVLPTTYQLTEDGVSSRTLFRRREKPWSFCRSYWIDKHGVLLSPFPRRSWLEAHRGLYVRFAGADRRAVVAFVERKVNEHVASGSGG